jgi:hypothetical protein
MRSLNKNRNNTRIEAAEMHFPGSVAGIVITRPKLGMNMSERKCRLTIFRIEFRATEISSGDFLKGCKIVVCPGER